MSERIDKGVMRQPVVCSLLLHAVVVALVSIGLPLARDTPLPVEEPVVVDLVPVAERSNPPPVSQVASRSEPAKAAAPPPAEPPEPKPEEQANEKPAEPKPVRPEPLPSPPARKPEPSAEARPAAKPDAKPDKPAVEPPAPKAQPKATTAPVPEPEAKPEPRPESKAEPKPQQKPKTPEPKAEPKPEPKAEPKPEPKAEPKAQPKAEPKAQPKAEPKAQPKAEPKPEPKSERKPEPATQERKPEPATDFAAVQRTVSDLKQRSANSTRPAEPAAQKERDRTPSDADSAFTSRVAQALRSSAPAGATDSLPVTSSEIDAVRRQIERCWNVPDGAKEAPDLVVALRVEMNLDGTPRSAVVEGSSRGQNNSYFQAAAESARRAVLNPRCHPFKFPPDKFDRWRTITLIFNPREMAGT
jgi:TolA protein